MGPEPQPAAPVRKPRRCKRPLTKAEAKAAHAEKMTRKKQLNEVLSPGFYPVDLWGRIA